MRVAYRYRLVMLAGAVLGAAAMLPSTAIAQQKSLKDQLVGTWILVTTEASNKDGTKAPPQVKGTPKGSLAFDGSGRFSFLVLGDVPRLASNNRTKTTPAEDKAIARNVFAYIGTYVVNEAEKTFDVKIEASSFANQVGSTGTTKRIIKSITADELKYTTPVTSTGTSVEWVWRRAK